MPDDERRCGEGQPVAETGDDMDCNSVWAKTVDRTMNAFLAATKPTKIPTGLVEFDRITGGLANGQVMVLAGRPCMGSSTVAMNIALAVARGTNGTGTPLPVGIFSLDWSQEMYVLRMACAIAKVPFLLVTSGSQYAGAEAISRLREATSILTKERIVVDAEGCLLLSEIEERARRMKAHYGIHLLVIDKAPFIQMHHFPLEGGVEQRRKYAERVLCKQVRALAIELDVPVIIMADVESSAEEDEERRGVPRVEDIIYAPPLDVFTPPSPGIVGLVRRPSLCLGSLGHDEEELLELQVVQDRHDNGETVKLRFEDTTSHVSDW